MATLGRTMPGNTVFVQMDLKRDTGTPTSMFGHQAHSSLRLNLPRFSGSKITFLKIDFFKCAFWVQILVWGCVRPFWLKSSEHEDNFSYLGHFHTRKTAFCTAC